MLHESTPDDAGDSSGSEIFFAVAPAERVFNLMQQNGGKGETEAIVTVTEQNGALVFKVDVTDKNSGKDALLALYFHISDPSLGSRLRFTDAVFTVKGEPNPVAGSLSHIFREDDVTTVGGNTNINGNNETGFDVGVAFPSGQEILSATFTLSIDEHPLDISFIGQQMGAVGRHKLFTAPNSAPVVSSDISVSGNEDEAISGRVTATDDDGDPLTYELASDGAPKYGSVMVNSDGTFSYIGHENYNGPDSFKVLIRDGNGGETTTEVKVNVLPVNDDPTAEPVSVSGEQEKDISGRVIGSDVDGDRLTYGPVAGEGPQNGTVTINPDGTFIYRGHEGFQGTDTFTVSVDDGNGGHTTALVTVQVKPSSTGSDPVPPAEVSYDDLIEAGDGDDFVHGGRGNDEIQGEGGNDTIYGGTDRGEITGDPSQGDLTILIGDNLYGNDGRDVFRYAKGDGVDMIWDFQPGEDVIELTGYSLDDIQVTWVGRVSNWIGTPWHAKLALVFKGGGGIVLNDYAGLDSSSAGALRLVDRIDPATGQSQVLTFAQLVAMAGAKPNEPLFNDSSTSVTIPAPGQPDPSEANASAGTAPSVEISFTNGDDTYAGGAGDDRLYGNDGYNWLEGHGGNDSLYGGNGKDVLIGGNGQDRLYGNEGENWLDGGAGSDEIYGGNVRDVILGGSGNDIVRGNSGDDWIIGGSGSDNLHGGGGADVIFGDDYIDGLIGGAPTLWAKPYENRDSDAPSPWVISEGKFLYTKASMKMAGDVRKVVATGKASLKITGNDLDNEITGNKGKNTIKAAGGDDVINGGSGNDTLSGGSGDDSFVFDTKLGTSKTNRKVNFDKVTDFTAKHDKIVLENDIFKKLTKTGTLNKKFFTVGSEAKDKNDYIIYNKKTGVLSYDKDGSGGADAVEFAQLKKGLNLTHKDFFVI